MSRIVLFLCFILSVVPAGAQVVTPSTGTITGTVTDASDAVIPGVTVTVSGPALMGNSVAVTDEAGRFRVVALPPGIYEAAFELPAFGTVVHEGIEITIGFTATLSVEMGVAGVEETVTVTGEAPVIDLESTSVTTSFNLEELSVLPGSRDWWSVVAQTPAVAMSRMDVGGSGAWTQQSFKAYGTDDIQRTDVEGIMVNEGNWHMYYTDYGSFEEISVVPVGNTAEVASAGVFSQLISKSGGNEYHGSAYFDYENDSMEAHNIDDAQVALGLRSTDIVPAKESNRLKTFRDFTADIGGYLKKDKLWFYFAYRNNMTELRFPTLVDDVQRTSGPVYTSKVTGQLNPNHKLTGYYQFATKHQPDYLGTITISGGRYSPALMTADSVWDSGYPNHVFKGEYNGVLSDSLFLMVRAGSMYSNWWRKGKSDGPRIEDGGSNEVSGGVYDRDNIRGRPQVNGSLSYFKEDWGGTHNLKFGGEVFYDIHDNPLYGFPHPSNSVSVLENGVPVQVRLYQVGNVTKNRLWAYSGYVSDSWQVGDRLTVNLGLRYDRYRPFLPEQEGPGGRTFPAINDILVWNNWGPRVGGVYDLTGAGKTVIKFNYGKFWRYPAEDIAAAVNPNSSQFYSTHIWDDPNGNGFYDEGEEGRLVSSQGGTRRTTFDPDTKNRYTHQLSAFFEHEVAAGFGMRTGFVWQGRRQIYGQVNVNRPLDAYTVPVSIQDPGPDGSFGTPDDAGVITGYNLAPEYLLKPVVNITRNLEENDSDYYTWEITATRRLANRWSMYASFANTWSHETALGTGGSYTPNALINAEDGRNKFTTWQAKFTSTVELPHDVRVVPMVRHQSGEPFARTFRYRLNVGNTTFKAHPVSTNRVANATLFDVRVEKAFALKNTTLTGFFDLYNIFNTNAEQALSTSSGSSYLRPSAITAPRILRLGIRFKW